MNGIIIGIDPVFAHLGSFMLRWYGLFFTLAIVAGVWLALREAARKRLPLEEAQSLAYWGVAGGLVGARLAHVIDAWDVYASAPWRALFVWEGGLAVYGGLIGGVFVGLGYALVRRLPVWEMGDAAAPGMLLGQAVGRLACIPNGDAYGAPANVPWGFIYTHPGAMVPDDLRGVPLHPYPVYELLFDVALLGVLWKLRLRPAFVRRPGLLFFSYAAAYSAGRFLLTAFRVERIWFWGLQEAQVFSLLGFAVAAAFVVYLVAVRGQKGLGPALPEAA